MSHKPSKLSRTKVNKQARHLRRVARRKLRKGLTADPRGYYKMAKGRR